MKTRYLIRNNSRTKVQVLADDLDEERQRNTDLRLKNRALKRENNKLKKELRRERKKL